MKVYPLTLRAPVELDILDLSEKVYDCRCASANCVSCSVVNNLLYHFFYVQAGRVSFH